MNKVHFTIHSVLQDLSLGESKELNYWGNPGVKDLIESLGIPHVEVGEVIVNGHSESFEYCVSDGDAIAINPVNWRLKSSSDLFLQPKVPDTILFVLDVHLGKLARLMRLFGFNAIYDTTFKDSEIIRIGIDEQRFILTRDKDLLKQSEIKFGHWVRNTDPFYQMDEILLYFDVFDQINPFSRCMSCNGKLKSVSKETIIDQLPPRVRKHYEVFQQCSTCHKVYWQGSHYERMMKMLWKLYGIEV